MKMDEREMRMAAMKAKRRSMSQRGNTEDESEMRIHGEMHKLPMKAKRKMRHLADARHS